MFQRLQKIFESIVYAGMRPGSRPVDPLYLSNRSLWQRARVAIFVTVPVLAICGFVLWAIFKPAETKQQAEPTREELAKRILPNLAKDIKIDTNRDVVVVNAVVDKNPVGISGTVANNTDHVVKSAELTFDLTNGNGSQIGAVSTVVKDLPPKSQTNFRFPVKQQDAAFVLVREIHFE